MRLQPVQTDVLVHALERGTQGVDVGVTPVTTANAQGQGAHHVVAAATSDADLVVRTLAHEL
ncbi:MAG: hypothetical protein LDL31_12270 [Prosthecobacter sp.]|nr:hypothetical protein [Prosthecobacter sp.]